MLYSKNLYKDEIIHRLSTQNLLFILNNKNLKFLFFSVLKLSLLESNECFCLCSFFGVQAIQQRVIFKVSRFEYFSSQKIATTNTCIIPKFVYLNKKNRF